MLIRDLLDLPSHVGKGDFVLALTEGIRDAEKTIRDYAITPSLVQSFDRALAVIGAGLDSKRSQASYLHGSFGSGKSHFMAVLELMLEGHAAPWTRTELHPLRSKYAWVGKAKLLRLPLHMIGASSIEQRVFEGYLDWVRANHPDAPTPSLFDDQALFDNARTLRASMGDELFFSKLNAGSGTARAGWGKLAAGATWDGPRFEAATKASELREREPLFAALTRELFTSYARQKTGFVELDRGLEVMTRHAQGLGYEGVVLFLDELILWLAGRIADLNFVQDEAQKLAKLREAQHSNRAVPVISFVAEQRDLKELVGEDAYGAQRKSVHDSLSWSKGRFDTIAIEERNLPAIVAHRVVRPRGDEQREALADGFARLRRTLGKDYEALLGSYGEEADFRKVYPFSPALVETLVDLSNCLQRERTAIRILMELLVEHLTDLENGAVVPVGDVFDVMASGEDAFDHVMRERFERAKNLYTDDFLPLIRAANQTATREKCQRLRDDHSTLLGCSRCPQTACRNDNRLAKTLLIAALVPESGPFKGLTVSRLLALNHGTVAAPFAGGEKGIAIAKVRSWASQIGGLLVGEQNDPEVALGLDRVDVNAILKSAEHADSLGAQKRLLKEILFDAFGLPADADNLVEKTVTWRGTRRTGVVRFANVRDLPESALECPADAAWSVVVDYPFDQAGYSPEDDLRRVEAFRESRSAAGAGASNPTMVWLPSFFSEKLRRELGQLAIIDFVLTGDNARTYLGHLRPEDQGVARQTLANLRTQKRAQLRRALDLAYGIVSPREEDLVDPARSIEEHVVSLALGMKAQPLLVGTLRDGLDQLAERLLEHRWPHHPRFGAALTPGKLEKVRALIERVVNAPDQRLQQVARDEIELLKDFASPLGLVQLGETSAHLDASCQRSIETNRARAGVERPTVAQVRAYVDPLGTLGLPREASDLMVWAFALTAGWSLERGGSIYTLEKLGKLPDDVELVRPDLPTAEEWQAALEKGAALFGVALPGRALTAHNLSSFAKQLAEGVKKVAAAGRTLPDALEERLRRWATIDPVPPRLETARSGAELVGRVKQEDPRTSPADVVRRLAAFEPRTSRHALERSLSAAATVLSDVKNEAVWLTFESVRRLESDPARATRARAILEELEAALTADQLNARLEEKLAELIRRAGELLKPGTNPPPPKKKEEEVWQPVATKSRDVERGPDVRRALLDLADELGQDLGDSTGPLRVVVSVVRRGGGGT